jgi:hypothetical protein
MTTEAADAVGPTASRVAEPSAARVAQTARDALEPTGSMVSGSAPVSEDSAGATAPTLTTDAAAAPAAALETAGDGRTASKPSPHAAPPAPPGNGVVTPSVVLTLTPPSDEPTAGASGGSPAPPPLPRPAEHGVTLSVSSSASGALGAAIVATLLSLLVLATPRAGRRVRPSPSLGWSPAFVPLLEHPG